MPVPNLLPPGVLLVGHVTAASSGCSTSSRADRLSARSRVRELERIVYGAPLP